MSPETDPYLATLTSCLPDGPDHPFYRAVEELIANYGLDIKKQVWLTEDAAEREFASDLFRALCELDFWAYCRYASSMRQFKIKEPLHPQYGELWIEQPELFDLCREFQRNEELRVTDAFYNTPRFTSKTLIITRHGTCWETLRDTSLTTAIITWKVDQVGQKIFSGVKRELEKNRVLHMHWPDVLWGPDEVPDLWRDRMLNVKREPGPEEPSISIHGMDSLPSSFHARRIVGDDCVVEETVKTARSIDLGMDRIRLATALGSEDTIRRWVGTIWSDGDPYVQLLAEGFFSKRYHRKALTGTEEEENYQDDEGFAKLLENGISYLHTKSFWKEWFGKLGFSLASCHLQNRPLARGNAYFRERWVTDNCYTEKPEEMAKNKPVYIIIDQAGEGQNSDYFAVGVVALGADRHFYPVDLWRERGLLLGEFYTLMLGQDTKAEIVEPVPGWIAKAGVGATGLVGKWKPKAVYIEEYFLTGYLAGFKLECKRRGISLRIGRLPTIKKRSKEDRIALLQAPMQRGEFHFPAAGFGHHSKSGPKDADLDTFEQFMLKEYKVWIRDPDANKTDDMLDDFAWLIQPETKSLFPFPVVKGDPVTIEQLLAQHFKAQRLSTGGSRDAWSW